MHLHTPALKIPTLLYQNQQTHRQSRAVCFHCSSHSSGTALMISTKPLISLQQLPKIPHFALFYSHWVKSSGCFMQLSQQKRNSRDSGRRGRGSKQHVTNVPPQCPATARSLDTLEVSLARRLRGNSFTVLSQFSPAWPSSASENNKSFPSLWGWCKIPHMHGGLGSHEVHQPSFCSSPHPPSHPVPRLRKRKWH